MAMLRRRGERERTRVERRDPIWETTLVQSKPEPPMWEYLSYSILKEKQHTKEAYRRIGLLRARLFEIQRLLEAAQETKHFTSTDAEAIIAAIRIDLSVLEDWPE